MKNRKPKKGLENRQAFFRKFTRKKFAAFNSMHRTIHISTLAAAYSLIVSPLCASAQSDSVNVSKVINLEEVEIVGQKSAGVFEEIPRMVSIVPQVEISAAPAQSVSDLLRYTGNIDVRQRGKSGIQSDLSIRGGSFDQTMILLNGINISDPQTGHLSLILPIDLEAINRIEVLNGSAARVHGANAFSGAINFVTLPSNINSVKLNASIGDFGYLSGSATLNVHSKNVKNLIYIDHAQSDGYVPNTDFKRQNLFLQSLISTQEGEFDLNFGYSDRSFGADGFYSPKYPDQFEQNQMTFASIGYKTGKKIKFEPTVYWRRHRDRFELFREDDDWYRIQDSITISNNPQTHYDTIVWYPLVYGHPNHHINDVFGAKANISIPHSFGTTTFGWHLRNENIISNNIGTPMANSIPVRGYPEDSYSLSASLTNLDLFAEQILKYKKLYISTGALLNWNTTMPDAVSLLPGIDIRYTITGPLSATASYNYALGLPTFTDLYYKDPSNEGNPKLKPYKQNTFEGGLQFLLGANFSKVCYYRNYGKDIIDWTLTSYLNSNNAPVYLYKPVNLPSYQSWGIEILSTHNFARQFGDDFILQSIRFSYSYLEVNKNIANEVTKYAAPRQIFASMAQFLIFQGLRLSVNVSYLERDGGYLTYNFETKGNEIQDFEPYFLTDARLSYTFNKFTAYLEATNLFDTQYIDAGSTSQPGRWITGGLQFELSGF